MPAEVDLWSPIRADAITGAEAVPGFILRAVAKCLGLFGRGAERHGFT